MRVPDTDPVSPAPDGRPASEQPTWRHDFPVDWPEDNLRARRDFTRFVMLTSLAFATGQVWIAMIRAFRRARGLPPEMEVAGAHELKVGGAKLFDYPGPGNACVLVRAAASEFVAFGQKCTHLSCPVIPRHDEGRFHCPCHEGAFDLQTGRPIAGPPRRPLPRVRLEIRGDKVFAVGIEEGIV